MKEEFFTGLIPKKREKEFLDKCIDLVLRNANKGWTLGKFLNEALYSDIAKDEREIIVLGSVMYSAFMGAIETFK